MQGVKNEPNGLKRPRKNRYLKGRETEKAKKKKKTSANRKMIFKHSATFLSFDSFKCKSERKWKRRGKKTTNPSC